MTMKQAQALKPGDIVIEKATGDQFRFLRMVEVSDIILENGRYKPVNPRKELAVDLIPGFEYSRRRYTNGPYFCFSHKRMAVREWQ